MIYTSRYRERNGNILVAERSGRAVRVTYSNGTRAVTDVSALQDQVYRGELTIVREPA